MPPTLLFLPLSQVVNALGLTDSVAALMVTYPTFLVPFCTWLLMGYFRTIPKEIEKCALVDGCQPHPGPPQDRHPGGGARNHLRPPLRLHALYALTFTSAADQKTITVGVTNDLIRGDIYC